MTEETTDGLMRATHCALCKHGFADVTMQDIADESEKSKAALHYHYESKHELLLSFLDYLLSEFTDTLDEVDGDSPTGRLVALVDTILAPAGETPDQEFQTAILEIKAQGPYDEAFQAKLREFDRLLTGRFQEIVRAGIDQDEFREDVDPEATAEFFVTVFNGAQTRYAAIGRPFEVTRASLLEYIETRVLAEDATLPKEVRAE